MGRKTGIAYKVTRATSVLSGEYGDPLLNNQRDPLDELVFILLSEKTDEEKYLKAFRRLKAHFLKWEGLLNAKRSQIESLIKDAGFGKRRAELLKRILQGIIQRFGSLDLSPLSSMTPVEAERELLCLPGIGCKAARCVLLYCFDFPVLPVDVHTYRLAVRLGFIHRWVSYEQSHTLLQKGIPQHLRKAFHVNAVAHGRTRCFAHDPDCQGCPLRKYCLHPAAAKPLPIEVRPKRLALDLFSGAGGLSLGFKKAGFQVVQAIESDPHAAATYRHNHPEADLLEEDICSFDPDASLSRLGLRPGDITVLINGPPCQGFSESNRRTRSLTNPQNHLYQQFLKFLKAVQPVWFVFENVAGLRTLSGGYILQRIIEECAALGYEVKWKELNAADYGVPQFRRRLFILGNRFGLPINFPESTRGPGKKPYVKVRQAINDLPELGNVQGNLVSHNAEKIIKRYRHIKSGQNWEAVPPELIDNYKDIARCHTGIYYRLEKNKPAKVIGNFRKNMLIHPEQNRGLSVREAARLQSFPDDYQFLGSIGFQQQQVADAVPPILAEKVAGAIKVPHPLDSILDNASVE